MADTTFPRHRLALIPVLAERAPGGQIGRTALMKFAYFLQTLRGVPLGYRFTLYSYGPYASDVLFDLDYAETLGAVTAERRTFPAVTASSPPVRRCRLGEAESGRLAGAGRTGPREVPGQEGITSHPQPCFAQ